MFLNLLALLHMAWFLGPLSSQQPSFNTMSHCPGLLKMEKGAKFHLCLPPSVEPLAPWTWVLRWVLLLCPSVSLCKPLHFLELTLFAGGPNLEFFPGCPLEDCHCPHAIPFLRMPFPMKFHSVVSSPVPLQLSGVKYLICSISRNLPENLDSRCILTDFLEAVGFHFACFYL